MEHLEAQLKSFQEKFQVSEEMVEEIRRLCVAHAINCSLDTTGELLDQSRAWMVSKIITHLEEEEAKLSKLKNLL